MKLLLAGNLANHGYFLVKLLREKNFDAQLLMKKNCSITEDPLKFDKNLTDYPDWINFYDTSKQNWKINIIKKMRKFELIQSSTELPIFSYLSKKPYISFALGADLAKLAKEKSIKGMMLNRAYKKSKIVVFSAPHLKKHADRIKIKKSIFLPLLWDYKKFQIKKIIEKNHNFVIFHPTNHLWNYKKNNLFLKAFSKLASDNKKAHLIMINRGVDFKKSKQIVKDAIENKQVTILPNTLSQSELIEYYHKSDVIVDQFGVGSTGLIGQEVMACGKPLIQYIDKKMYNEFYSEIPPILNSKNEYEIYQNLSELCNDPNLGINIGKKSQQWILENHNPEKIIKKYIYLYEAINEKIEFDEIKDRLKF